MHLQLVATPCTCSCHARCGLNKRADVPFQVRWVGFQRCWVTAADDDTLRTWSPEGHKLQQWTYTGGSVQCLYVDNLNR